MNPKPIMKKLAINKTPNAAHPIQNKTISTTFSIVSNFILLPFLKNYLFETRASTDLNISHKNIKSRFFLIIFQIVLLKISN